MLKHDGDEADIDTAIGAEACEAGGWGWRGGLAPAREHDTPPGPLH